MSPDYKTIPSSNVENYKRHLEVQFENFVKSLSYCRSELDKLRVLNHFLKSISIFLLIDFNINFMNGFYTSIDALKAVINRLESYPNIDDLTKELKDDFKAMLEQHIADTERTEEFRVDDVIDISIAAYKRHLNALSELESSDGPLVTLHSDRAKKLRDALALDANRITYLLGPINENFKENIPYSELEMENYFRIYTLIELISIIINNVYSLLPDEKGLIANLYRMLKAAIFVNNEKILSDKTSILQDYLDEISQMNFGAEELDALLLKLKSSDLLITNKNDQYFFAPRLNKPFDVIVEKLKEYCRRISVLIEKLKSVMNVPEEKANFKKELLQIMLEIKELKHYFV
jgi:hypothetical protein